MSTWRPALRMARRDLRRHKVRAALTCLLVALPVFVATIASLVERGERWDRDREAQMIVYSADARVTVTKHSAVRAGTAAAGSARHAPGAVRRDPAGVDLEELLPEGTSWSAAPWFEEQTLTTGGMAQVIQVDLTARATRGFITLSQGRAPTAPDEVAVPEAVAAELGLLSDGRLRPGATLDLLGGTPRAVTGVVEAVENSPFDELSFVTAPSTTADRRPRSYLADLPEMTRPELKALVGDLAAAGVALQPRDAILHPRAWGIRTNGGDNIDLTPLLVGALCILVGLVEVVLLVGAAFSVAARRQVRDLGLLATNGGAGRDVRRVLLAQGLVLGLVSSALGAAAGVLAFELAAADVYRRLDRTLWSTDVSWPTVVLIAVLGSTTSVVAALLPGWRVSRLTPVQALSGRFPVRPGESRAHRPAFALAGAGLVLLLGGGWAISYLAGRPDTDSFGAVAVMTAGIGLLLLVAGAVWCAPYVVRRVAQLGKDLPLAGRYAFRDAGRHRFRTAAAVMALMITVAGAVMAAFGFRAASRSSFDESAPPQTMVVDLWRARDPQQVAAARATVERIVRPVEMAMASHVSLGASRDIPVFAAGGYELHVVDEASLRLLARVDETSLELFRSGGALTFRAASVRDDQIRLVADRRRDRQQWTLPAAAVLRGDLRGGYFDGAILVSEQTAASLGLEKAYATLVVRAADPIPAEVVDRLRIYGLYRWTADPDRALASRLQYAGLGAAALLTALVVGIAVAMAAAESRDDVATLAAVGAGPWRRRGFGAMHGLFLGIVGCLLGLGVGVPAGVSFSQLDALSGVDVPWLPLLGTVCVVLALSWTAGAVVTPSRFRLTRRVA